MLMEEKKAVVHLLYLINSMLNDRSDGALSSKRRESFRRWKLTRGLSKIVALQLSEASRGPAGLVPHEHSSISERLK